MQLPAVIEEEEEEEVELEEPAGAPSHAGRPGSAATRSRSSSATVITTVIDRTSTSVASDTTGLSGFGRAGGAFGAFGRPSADLTGKSGKDGKSKVGASVVVAFCPAVLCHLPSARSVIPDTHHCHPFLPPAFYSYTPDY